MIDRDHLKFRYNFYLLGREERGKNQIVIFFSYRDYNKTLGEGI